MVTWAWAAGAGREGGTKWLTAEVRSESAEVAEMEEPIHARHASGGKEKDGKSK